MRPVIILALGLTVTMGFAAETPQNSWDPNYVVSEETARNWRESGADPEQQRRRWGIISTTFRPRDVANSDTRA